MTRIIDGKAVAATVRAEVGEGVAEFAAEHGRPPGLVGIQVGDASASEIYQRMKAEDAEACGMAARRVQLPAGTTPEELGRILAELDEDEAVDGVLVQLPVPPPLEEPAIAAAIDAVKDVDGFSPANLGRLVRGEPAHVPCTPAGVMRLLAEAEVELEGARTVVIGRSTIVGKPMGLLLTAANATVTIAHSRTRDLAALAREAEVLIVAVGRAEMVRGDWIRPGATVIDVGTNRTDDGLKGDVAFEEARAVAGAITPVPGGVGPMTRAYLLVNTLTAARRRAAGDA